MGIVPDKKPEKVSWFQSKIEPWTTNSAAIGVSSSNVASLSTLVTAAATAVAAQITAEAAFRGAVSDANMAVGAMAAAGADLISAIRTKARTAGDGVFTLAQIPVPANPSPVPAPGMPSDFSAELQNNGALTLKWKCANPRGASGTTYQVWRRLAGTSDLAFIGVTGKKEFVDSTVPAGTVQATYQIQAFRSTLPGPWNQFNVNFTTDIGGSVTASVTTAASRKAA